MKTDCEVDESDFPLIIMQCPALDCDPMLFLGFTLPASQNQSASAVVLVVDDEVIVRNVVCLVLQREGYEVLSAADGEEALALSRKYAGHIDLLITDVEMPRMAGYPLAEYLSNERPGIRILVMSGKTSEQVHQQNAHLPFIKKPFLPADFRGIVRRLLSTPNCDPEHI